MGNWTFSWAMMYIKLCAKIKCILFYFPSLKVVFFTPEFTSALSPGLKEWEGSVVPTWLAIVFYHSSPKAKEIIKSKSWAVPRSIFSNLTYSSLAFMPPILDLASIMDCPARPFCQSFGKLHPYITSPVYFSECPFAVLVSPCAASQKLW